jgi:hypothetical protein
MSQLKNSEGITGHLQRIFIYGDEIQESHRVNSFLEYLTTKINPFTSKPYELGARSLYRYIGGEQHFPVDLLPALVSWSLDEKLMTAFNIYPAPSDMDRLNAKIEEKEKRIKEEAEELKRLKALARKK